VWTNLWWFLAWTNFFAKDYKMKEEKKFITTNTHFSHTPFAAEKKLPLRILLPKSCFKNYLSLLRGAQTRDLAIRGTGQPAKGEQVFSGLTRDRG